MTLDSLRRVRDGHDAVKWRLLPFEAARDERVLAVDQSLAATGWALMASEHPHVMDTGVIVTTPVGGHEGNLTRGVLIYDEVLAVLSGLGEVDRVVHEAPPVFIAGMHRPDSSLLASLAVRLASRHFGVPVTMESAQTAKVRLCGDARASKAEVKAALASLWPDLPGKQMRWNEHIRDAVAIGIISLERPDEPTD